MKYENLTLEEWKKIESEVKTGDTVCDMNGIGTGPSIYKGYEGVVKDIKIEKKHFCKTRYLFLIKSRLDGERWVQRNYELPQIK